MPTSPRPTTPLDRGTSEPADLSRLGTLLTVAEVASYLRVSEMTVYRTITSGAIAATKVGRGWRITEADLAAYLDDRRVPRAS